MHRVLFCGEHVSLCQSFGSDAEMFDKKTENFNLCEKKKKKNLICHTFKWLLPITTQYKAHICVFQGFEYNTVLLLGLYKVCSHWARAVSESN